MKGLGRVVVGSAVIAASITPAMALPELNDWNADQEVNQMRQRFQLERQERQLKNLQMQQEQLRMRDPSSSYY